MTTKKIKKRTIKKNRKTTTKKRVVRKAKAKNKVNKATKKIGLLMGGTTSAKNIKFKASARKGTKYQPLLDRMASLKQGQGFVVDVPSNSDPRNFHNRLNAVLHRAKIKPPKNCKFEKRTTENGKIGIRLVLKKNK